jgi:hypothetical protein
MGLVAGSFRVGKEPASAPRAEAVGSTGCRARLIVNCIGLGSIVTTHESITS